LHAAQPCLAAGGAAAPERRLQIAKPHKYFRFVAQNKKQLYYNYEVEMSGQ